MYINNEKYSYPFFDVSELEVENRFGDRLSPYILEINRPFMVLIMTKNVAIFSARILDPTKI